jgi:hypothetical protein
MVRNEIRAVAFNPTAQARAGADWTKGEAQIGVYRKNYSTKAGFVMAPQGHDRGADAVSIETEAPLAAADRSARKVEVVVIGDMHWDSVIVPSPHESADPKSPGSNYTRVVRRGGAWLLERFIKIAADSVGEHIKVLGYTEASEDKTKTDIFTKLGPDQWDRALTVVKLFPEGVADQTQKTFRIEKGYGWVERRPTPETAEKKESADEEKKKAIECVFKSLNDSINDATNRRRPGTPIPDLRIVVIDDYNRSFRYLDTSSEVVEGLASTDRVLFVLTMHRPLANEDDKIWKIIKRHPEQTVVVVSSSDLRSEGLNLPEEVPLEMGACAYIENMQHDTVLKRLMVCQHVIICSDSGIFHFDKDKINNKDRFDYYFRPYEFRARFNVATYGAMSGYRRIIMASIVNDIIAQYKACALNTMSKVFNRIPYGIRLGLKLCERHFRVGFSKSLHTYCVAPKSEEGEHPFDHLFQPKAPHLCSKEAELPLAWVQFPFQLETLRTWSRLTWFRERLAINRKSGVGQDVFVEFLAEVVREGLEKAINNHQEVDSILCPVVKFAGLEAVDQEEISGLFDIHRIIQKYLEEESWKTPLSLAVFGPPGAGKSFTIKEILKAARSSNAKARGDVLLTFNLAQFTTSANLTTAFHQVQDRVLAAKEVPLIFFDEFDSSLGDQLYGWLKYFLAPMQDGKFKGAEAEGSYEVGRAIFVFAGGTAETFDAFKTAVSKDDTTIINAKGKDFISRLRAYMDIKGIDKKEGERGVSDLLALRRAIILRSILQEKASQIFDSDIANIDNELIYAFLRIDCYAHGKRSMEAIVEMSRPERNRLQVASLPSRDQLRMHVDDERFLDLTTRGRH